MMHGKQQILLRIFLINSFAPLQVLTLASIFLVLATSNGVVIAAAIPPAIAPQTAPCHGSTGWP